MNMVKKLDANIKLIEIDYSISSVIKLN